uniref:Uncharacterized protein n=1 Tax=Cacopsylla melanoneura TaxID=428564 RepID=A0A8D8LP27_9HEMI
MVILEKINIKIYFRYKSKFIFPITKYCFFFKCKFLSISQVIESPTKTQFTFYMRTKVNEMGYHVNTKFQKQSRCHSLYTLFALEAKFEDLSDFNVSRVPQLQFLLVFDIISTRFFCKTKFAGMC